MADDRWEARITAMHGAGHTFCKALHLAPWRGSAWGDAVAAADDESQLRRSHPGLQQDSIPKAAASGSASTARMAEITAGFFSILGGPSKHRGNPGSTGAVPAQGTAAGPT
ncbi:hypothetical protein WJX74_000458 [Apatococcus lobatus]|uniref:Uncharacterized protein n=1 Tax=Apatococcus lobatus TaxID=904363 RepID=A0AAW1S138_9CHLO